MDNVAERIAALGGTAEGTIDVVGQRTKLAAYPLNITSGRDHVQALSAALAAVDKRLWFVEAQLQGDKVIGNDWDLTKTNRPNPRD